MPGTLSTAGMPSSRATIAAWLWTAPVSQTTAAALRNSGVQDGSVIGQTSTSPGSSPRGSAGSRITRAGPDAVPPLTAMPDTVVPAAGAVGRDSARERPRVGVGDVPVEPGWWEAGGEVALLLGAGRDQVGEGVGLATKSASSVTVTQKARRSSLGPPRVGRPTNQFVEHEAGTQVLEHEDVLGPLTADRALPGDQRAAPCEPSQVARQEAEGLGQRLVGVGGETSADHDRIAISRGVSQPVDGGIDGCSGPSPRPAWPARTRRCRGVRDRQGRRRRPAPAACARCAWRSRRARRRRSLESVASVGHDATERPQPLGQLGGVDVAGSADDAVRQAGRDARAGKETVQQAAGRSRPAR